MRIAITGATGFFGRYIVNHLLDEGHECRCWHRPDSDLGGFRDEGRSIRWVPGELNDPGSTDDLVRGADAVVHAAVEWGRGADLAAYAQANITGSLRLMESARAAGARRFVFISTCAVHERILEDRPLDEAHPLWPASHYGAAKASVEKFLHSFALGHDWCAIGFRPPGIYGLRRPLRRSHWYDLVRDVLADRPIRTSRGGKVLDAADGASAIGLLLKAPKEKVRGEVFNGTDMYVADQDVALIAKQLSSSSSEIQMLNPGPRHQIDSSKIRALGLRFGGRARLEQYVAEVMKGLRDQGLRN